MFVFITSSYTHLDPNKNIWRLNLLTILHQDYTLALIIALNSSWQVFKRGHGHVLRSRPLVS